MHMGLNLTILPESAVQSSKLSLPCPSDLSYQQPSPQRQSHQRHFLWNINIPLHQRLCSIIGKKTQIIKIKLSNITFQVLFSPDEVGQSIYCLFHMTSSRGVSMSRMCSIAAPRRRGNLCRLSTSNRGADPDPFCRYLILHWLSQLGMFADSLRARSHYIFLNSSHFTFYVFRL